MAPSTWSDYSAWMGDLQYLSETTILDDFLLETSSSSEHAYSPSQHSGDHPPSPTTSTTTSGFTCTVSGCDCGGQTFRRRSDLNKHVEKRTRPYACRHAGCTRRPFSTKYDLNRHEHDVHGIAPAGRKAVSLRCPVVSCKRHTKGFGRKENLAAHIRNMHPEGTQAETYFSEMQALAPTTSAMAVAEAPVAISPVSARGPMGAADSAMPYGLQERLCALHSQRAALARQMSAVDEQIGAVLSGMQNGGNDLNAKW